MEKKENNILFSTLISLVQKLRETKAMSDMEIISAVCSACENKVFIPVEVIRNRNLGPLECIVKYLKEKRGLSYHQIAEILERDDRTIWVTYRNSIKKGGVK
ncbi:MAG: hypothetical protein QXK37_05910 [Candidatus Woesearchaeota archaeon]